MWALLCTLLTLLSIPPHFSAFVCLSLGSCIPLHLAATRRPHSAALGIWTIHLVCQVHRHLCRLALCTGKQQSRRFFSDLLSYNLLQSFGTLRTWSCLHTAHGRLGGAEWFQISELSGKEAQTPTNALDTFWNHFFYTAAKCPFTVHDPSPALWLRQQIAPYTQCLFSRLELWNAITKGRFSQQLKLTVSLCNSACLLYSKETLVQTPSCLSSYDKIQTAHAPAGASAADLSYTWVGNHAGRRVLTLYFLEMLPASDIFRYLPLLFYCANCRQSQLAIARLVSASARFWKAQPARSTCQNGRRCCATWRHRCD